MVFVQFFYDSFIIVMGAALFVAFLPYVLSVSVKMLDKIL